MNMLTLFTNVIFITFNIYLELSQNLYFLSTVYVYQYISPLFVVPVYTTL